MRQWKVGSLTLGLTLIFIGTIFIIGNTADMTLLGKLIKFWPIIFILLGVEILASSYFAQKNNEKLKLGGVSIFMFFIIFILCGSFFIGNMVMEFTKDGIRFRDFYSLKYKYQSNFTKNYTIQPKNSDKVIINTRSGNVYIDKSSSNNIEITADGNILCNDEKLIETLPNSLVKISQGNPIEITTDNKYDNFNGNSNSTNLNLHIKLPEKIYAEVLSSYGNIEVKNLSKGLKITNKDGNILVEDISGDLIIENSFGKTTVNNIKGNVTTKSKDGNLEVIGVTGSLIAKNSFGLIDLADISGKVDVDSSDGEIRFENSKIISKDLTLNSKHGNINLSIPREQTGHFILNTKFGRINNDFNLSIDKSENSDKESVDKIIGNNTLPIKIYSDNGSININSR